MKVIIFGATGMVGQGVLRECLLDSDVESVVAVVRNASLPQHDKLREIVHQEVSDLAAIEDRLSGYDTCFFCLVVSDKSSVVVGAAGSSECSWAATAKQAAVPQSRTAPRAQEYLTRTLRERD